MKFYTPEEKLPKKGQRLFLCRKNPYAYEAGFMFDGENFRRSPFPIIETEPGEIIDCVFAWAVDSYRDAEQSNPL